MSKFTFDGFIKYNKLIEKHREIFVNGNPKYIDEFKEIFKRYTDFINTTDAMSDSSNSIQQLINLICSDYKLSNNEFVDISKEAWATDFRKFCNADGNNQLYTFPTGREKINFHRKFEMTCLLLKDADPNTVRLVNRHGHMIYCGNPKKNKKTYCDFLSFKIVILHNKKAKKWLVVPYRMKPESKKIKCDIFAMVATTDNIIRQYQLWIDGFDKYGNNIGILNGNYYDKSFDKLPNLFNQNQKNILNDKLKIVLEKN
jgi:hypothetical protein